jgi:hypothetical protein
MQKNDAMKAYSGRYRFYCLLLFPSVFFLADCTGNDKSKANGNTSETARAGAKVDLVDPIIIHVDADFKITTLNKVIAAASPDQPNADMLTNLLTGYLKDCYNANKRLPTKFKIVYQSKQQATEISNGLNDAISTVQLDMMGYLEDKGVQELNFNYPILFQRRF